MLGRIPIRYGSLLLAIILTHLLVPAFEGRLFGGFLILVLFGLVQVAAVATVSRRRSKLRLWSAGALMVLSQGLLWATVVYPADVLRKFSIAVWVLFNVYVVVILLLNLLRSRTVTTDTILGGISIYLLVGFAWAGVLLFLEIASPGSFRGLSAELKWADFLYLSFVTLTTLGYGDIVPLTMFARSLTTLESVFGVIYLAVLVSRLVGMHLSQAGRGVSEG